MGTKKMHLTISHFFAALLVGISCVAQAATVQLDVEPSVGIGATFDMNVIINEAFSGKGGLEEILAFGFDVTIEDNSIVSLINTSVAFPFDDDSDFFENTDVAGSAFPGLPNDGSYDSLLLGTLTFMAMAPGTVSIGIYSDLTDFNEGLIYLFDSPLDITTTTSITVIPIPYPIWLFASGLVGLISIARRNNSGY